MRKNLTLAFILISILPIIEYSCAFNELWSLLIGELSILLAILSLYIPTSYEYKFDESCWNTDGNEMKIILSSKKHKQGKKITCELYEHNSRYGYQQCLADIYVKDGDITICVPLGGSFAGKLVVNS